MPPEAEEPDRGEPASLEGMGARLRACGSVFAEEEARVLADSATSPAELARMVSARERGRPLEHVVGWVEFAGLRVAVDDGVFVPRRRSELLVHLAAEDLRAPDPVVELCCGAGAIAAALVARRPGLEPYAVDLDPAATALARRNLPAAATVLTGDLDAPLPAVLRGRVVVLVANAPYVPTAELAMMPPEARDHEPRMALDGGTDGLDLHRRITGTARHWLAPGGRLLLEAGARQAATTAGLMAGAGLEPVVREDPDRDAVVVAGTNLSPTCDGVA